MELLERASLLDGQGGLYGQAARGSGCLDFVGGEAGIGKTALVGRFGETLGAMARVLIGACDPLATPRLSGPLLDVAPALGDEVERLLRKDARRDRVFAAILAALNDGPPPVFAVEDVHWADDATLDLLRRGARRVPGGGAGDAAAAGVQCPPNPRGGRGG